jgi:phage terminase large subunit-like protein
VSAIVDAAGMITAAGRSAAERLAQLPDAIRKEVLGELTEDEARALEYDWAFWRRPSQELPPEPWSLAMWMTGRGYGKTRIGSEAINEWAKEFARMFLVGRTSSDVRDVMIEGESGILASSPPWWRPEYEPSKRRLTWPNGAIATAYTGEEPDMLRGPQFEKGWMDELAAWQYPQEAFDNAMFGLRLGDNPQAVITTTPKNVPIIRKLVRDPDVKILTGTTYENIGNLAPLFIRRIVKRYEGTRLGMQELLGKLLEDVAGALWSRERIDALRVRVPAAQLVRVVVAVDPPAGQTQVEAVEREETAECGIVVCASGWCSCMGRPSLHGFVLEDATIYGKPDEWGDRALQMYKKWRADRIVAEANNGGEMVGFVIAARPGGIVAPVTLVWASRGKQTRAEPVAALYAPRSEIPIHHVGSWPELEDQQVTWVPGERSPDRMDALVWGITQLFLSEGETAEQEGTLVHDEPSTISPV